MCIFLYPYLIIYRILKKKVTKNLGCFGTPEAEISVHRGVSGGPTDILDTFFESPTLGPYRPQISFGAL